jgi:hypothetical protein
MKNLYLTLFAGLMTGCASMPTTGILYTENQTPQSVSSNQAGNRVGEGCITTYLGLVSTGDASVETARRMGGITMITSVDIQTKSILGIWTKYCAIVRGR